MKTKELNEFRNQTRESVEKEIARLREKLEEVKLDMASGKATNLKEAKGVKRDIAQLLTIVNTIEVEKKTKNKSKQTQQ